jgi:hypothetical protein
LIFLKSRGRQGGGSYIEDELRRATQGLKINCISKLLLESMFFGWILQGD